MLLSRALVSAASKVSSSMMAGMGISIHSSRGRSGLAVPAQGRVVAGVGAVPIQSTDVGLVAEQSADGGQSPHRFALGRGDSFGGEGDGEVP